MPLLVAEEHGTASDRHATVAARALLADMAGRSRNEFFWSGIASSVLADIDHAGGSDAYFAQEIGVPAETVPDVMAAQHAWTLRNLQSKRIPASVKSGGSLVVVRTWSSTDTLINNAAEISSPDGAPLDPSTLSHLSPGQSVLMKKHAVYESTSVRHAVVVAGNHAMLYRVPLHRVWMPYWIGREGNEWTSFLYASENELVVVLDGVRGTYAGEVEDGRTVRSLVRMLMDHGVAL